MRSTRHEKGDYSDFYSNVNNFIKRNDNARNNGE